MRKNWTFGSRQMLAEDEPATREGCGELMDE